MMDQNKLKGHLAMIAANISWGLMAPLSKIVMGDPSINPWMLVSFRVIGVITSYSIHYTKLYEFHSGLFKRYDHHFFWRMACMKSLSIFAINRIWLCRAKVATRRLCNMLTAKFSTRIHGMWKQTSGRELSRRAGQLSPSTTARTFSWWILL